MKKWDKIIIASLLVLSFLPHLFFGMFVSKDYNKTYAVVTVNGKPYKEIPLTGQISAKDYRIETEYGTNLLRVENERIAIIEADCPDKICVEPGFIHKPGQSLVCLPNRVYVEIEGINQEQEGIDIKAY